MKQNRDHKQNLLKYSRTFKNLNTKSRNLKAQRQNTRLPVVGLQHWKKGQAKVLISYGTMGQDYLLPVLKFIFKTCVQPSNLHSKHPEAIQTKVRRCSVSQTQARGVWNMYGYLPRPQTADRQMRSFAHRSKAKNKRRK